MSEDFGRCGLCGHPLDGREGLRHFGSWTAHHEYRCLALLKGDLAALRAERDALAERVLEALDGLAMTAVEYDSDAFGLPSMVERNTGRAEGVRRAIEVMRTTVAALLGTDGQEPA